MECVKKRRYVYWPVLIVMIILWVYLGIHFLLPAVLEGWTDGIYVMDFKVMYAHMVFTCLLGIIGVVPSFAIKNRKTGWIIYNIALDYFISSFYWVLMVRSIIDDISYEYPQIVDIIPDKTLCLLVMAEFCITKIIFIPIILLSYYLQNKFLFKEIVEKEKNRVKKFVLLFTAVNTLGIVNMMIFNVAVMLIGYHCALG